MKKEHDRKLKEKLIDNKIRKQINIVNIKEQKERVIKTACRNAENIKSLRAVNLFFFCLN